MSTMTANLYSGPEILFLSTTTNQWLKFSLFLLDSLSVYLM